MGPKKVVLTFLVVFVAVAALVVGLFKTDSGSKSRDEAITASIPAAVGEALKDPAVAGNLKGEKGEKGENGKAGVNGKNGDNGSCLDGHCVDMTLCCDKDGKPTIKPKPKKKSVATKSVTKRKTGVVKKTTQSAVVIAESVPVVRKVTMNQPVNVEVNGNVQGSGSGGEAKGSLPPSHITNNGGTVIYAPVNVEVGN